MARSLKSVPTREAARNVGRPVAPTERLRWPRFARVSAAVPLRKARAAVPMPAEAWNAWETALRTPSVRPANSARQASARGNRATATHAPQKTSVSAASALMGTAATQPAAVNAKPATSAAPRELVRRSAVKTRRAARPVRRIPVRQGPVPRPVLPIPIAAPGSTATSVLATSSARAIPATGRRGARGASWAARPLAVGRRWRRCWSGWRSRC